METTKDYQPTFFDRDDTPHLGGEGIQFATAESEPVTPYSQAQDIGDECRMAQDRLAMLREQEEQLRQEAAQLEELAESEKAFLSGRDALTQNISSRLTALEARMTEARSLIENGQIGHDQLQNHLIRLQGVRPDAWSREQRGPSLQQAHAALEEAQADLQATDSLAETSSGKTSSNRKTAHHAPAFISQATQGDFNYWLKSGFAFALPLIGLGALVMVLFRLF